MKDSARCLLRDNGKKTEGLYRHEEKRNINELERRDKIPRNQILAETVSKYTEVLSNHE